MDVTTYLLLRLKLINLVKLAPDIISKMFNAKIYRYNRIYIYFYDCIYMYIMNHATKTQETKFYDTNYAIQLI